MQRLPFAVAIALSLVAPRADAATFTVDTTSDVALSACTAADGDCSLRGAISAANAAPGADTIAFALPTSDAGYQPATQHWRFAPATNLPEVSSAVTVDGFTQPGAVPSAHLPLAPIGHTLKLELAGPSFNSTYGLSALPGASLTVRGLAIGGFQTAIYLFPSGTHVIAGNYLGTDITGLAARPNRYGIAPAGETTIGGATPDAANVIAGNAFAGIQPFGQVTRLRVLGNFIGTTRLGTAALPGQDYGISLTGTFADVEIGGIDVASANVISGHEFAGLYFSGGGTVAPGQLQARVIGNVIGVSASGAVPLGNGLNPLSPSQRQPGVQIFRSGACGVAIGGLAPGEGNLIGYSGTAGVQVSACWSAPILGNAFVANGSLPIDVAVSSNGDGGTPNDPGDVDGTGTGTGVIAGNRLQNTPEIVALIEEPATSSLRVRLRVDSAPTAAAYPLRLDFYRRDAQGIRAPAVSASYELADAQSPRDYVLAAADLGADIGIVVTDAEGNSSEMLLLGRVFADGFEAQPTPEL